MLSSTKYVPCYRPLDKLDDAKFEEIGVIGNKGEERHKGRVIVDERQAILGKNNLVKLVYPNSDQRREEADYLRKFEGVCGVPWLYESSRNYNIVEQCSDDDYSEQSNHSSTSILFQMVYTKKKYCVFWLTRFVI